MPKVSLRNKITLYQESTENEMTTREVTIKEWYAGVALLAAIGFGIAGISIPPLGEVDGSTLTLIGQMLIFAATLVGLGTTYQKISNIVSTIKGDGSKNKATKNSKEE